MQSSDEHWMQQALEVAQEAMAEDEVPVGAVLVGPDGTLLGRAHDARMRLHDPTAHAEILTMRQAGEKQGDWRLENCDLYVTLEPCPMCAGAIVMSRIRRLIYGAPSPKSGAIQSHLQILDIETFNHRVVVQSGILAEQCGKLLTEYFKKRR